MDANIERRQTSTEDDDGGSRSFPDSQPPQTAHPSINHDAVSSTICLALAFFP